MNKLQIRFYILVIRCLIYILLDLGSRTTQPEHELLALEMNALWGDMIKEMDK